MGGVTRDYDAAPVRFNAMKANRCVSKVLKSNAASTFHDAAFDRPLPNPPGVGAKPIDDSLVGEKSATTKVLHEPCRHPNRITLHRS
jgi:hypothetical protein